MLTRELIEEWIAAVDDPNFQPRDWNPPEVPERINSQWLSGRCHRAVSDRSLGELIALAYIARSLWSQILDTTIGSVVMAMYTAGILGLEVDPLDVTVDPLRGGLRAMLRGLLEAVPQLETEERQILFLESLVLSWISLLLVFSTESSSVGGGGTNH